MKKRVYGFTIVELLIVIVVIAILAAISIAAYTNIQSRARAAAVQSDLTNAMKQLKLYRVTQNYPTSTDELKAVGITVSKDMYDLQASGGAANLYYCLNRTTDEAIIGARVRGNKEAFFITSSGSVTKITPPNDLYGGPLCRLIGLASDLDPNGYYTYGYVPSTGSWRDWVK